LKSQYIPVTVPPNQGKIASSVLFRGRRDIVCPRVSVRKEPASFPVAHQKLTPEKEGGKLKRAIPVLLLVTVFTAFPMNAFPADSAGPDSPWETFSFTFGGFIADVNSDVRLGLEGTGTGIDVNLEEALGLETTSSVFRVGATYRFGKSRRHQAEFSWFKMDRSAGKTLGRDVVVDNVTYPIGTTVDSFLDLQIYKAAYNYSFLQDDRINLAAGIGVFVMPIKYGVSASGIGATAEDITAPLPVIGLRADFALTPKWFLRASTDVFYLKVGDFKGAVWDSMTAVEYKPWKNFGLGLAANQFKLGIEAQGSDYPNVDFVGNIKFDYVGLMLYGKLFY
jgi:hypothetical protein